VKAPAGLNKGIVARDVQEFYDEFLERRMIGYRIDGNARIEAAIEFIARYVKAGALVADIGCGVGIVAESLARREPTAKVLGVDISEANIAYARKTVCLPNVEFLAASVTEQFRQLQQHAGGAIDVICLVDVIEHIPMADRRQVLVGLATLAGPDRVLLLTYPSPEYQRYLMQERPDELQIVDNVIEIEALFGEASAAGWHLRSFSYVDVWRENQYIHAAFLKDITVRERPLQVPSVRQRLVRLLDRTFAHPARVRKYSYSSPRG
jgi:trans-aconitate 2-methyltransferase